MEGNVKEYIEKFRYREAIEEIKKKNFAEDGILDWFFKQDKEVEEDVVEDIEKIIEKKEHLYKNTCLGIGQYYLNKNKNKAIHYLEKYLSYVPENKQIKILLMKFLMENCETEKAYMLIVKNDEFCEEEADLAISLILSNIEFEKAKVLFKKIIETKQREIIIKLIRNIIDDKIFVKGLTLKNDCDIWMTLIENEEGLNILDKEERCEIKKFIALYYKEKQNIEKSLNCFKELLEIDNTKDIEVYGIIFELLSKVKKVNKNYDIYDLLHYIEKYLELVPENKQVGDLLLKFLVDNNEFEKAYMLIMKNNDFSKEQSYLVISLILSNIEFEKAKVLFKKIIETNQKEVIIKLIRDIISNKIFIEGLTLRDDCEKWMFLVENEKALNILDKKEQYEIKSFVALYYRKKENIEKSLFYFTELLKIDNTKDVDVYEVILELLAKIKINDKNYVTETLLQLSEISSNKKIKNIFLNEAEILQNKLILKSRPRQLQVLLTTKCNLRCVMCSVCKANYTISEEYLKFVKDNIPYLERILWQGGEVFLYENFNELMELAAKNNVCQGFITNGLLLTKERIDLIYKYNVNLSISVDAVTKELYEKIRFGAKFENLLNVLENLHRKKQQCKDFNYVMAIVIMASNYNQIDQMIEFAVKYGFSEMWFQLVRGADSSISLNSEQEKQVRDKFNEMKENRIIIHTNMSNTMDSDWYKPNVEWNIDTSKPKEIINTTDKVMESSKTVTYKEVKNMKEVFNQNVICLAPWKTLFFDMNVAIKPSCYCHSYVPEGKCDDLWNSKELIKSREYIINKLVPEECFLCFELGDCGFKNRMGML